MPISRQDAVALANYIAYELHNGVSATQLIDLANALYAKSPSESAAQKRALTIDIIVQLSTQST